MPDSRLAVDPQTSITRELMIAEAERRGWQVDFLGSAHEPHTYYSITDTAGRTVWFKGSTPQQSSFLGNRIARNKLHLLAFAQRLGYEIPAFMEYTDEPTALAFMRQHGSIVVKPSHGEQANGVTLGVSSPAALHAALPVALEHAVGGSVMLQKELPGKLYRLLVIGNQLFAATHRRAAFVTGDGVHTVRELISQKNADPRRQGQHAPLKNIDIEQARQLLGEHELARVVAPGQEVLLASIPTIRHGGEAEDVTELVHPEYRRAAVAITQALQLSICGLDVMAADIGRPLPGYFPLLEANSMPGFKMHVYPSAGPVRNPAPALLDAVFSRRQAVHKLRA